MASTEEVARLRLLTDEPLTTSSYNDSVLGSYADTFGVHGAAAEVWRHKAAEWAKLVDTSESGAARSLSAMMDHALAMAKKYEALAGTSGAGTGRARVVKIERC